MWYQHYQHSLFHLSFFFLSPRQQPTAKRHTESCTRISFEVRSLSHVSPRSRDRLHNNETRAASWNPYSSHSSSGERLDLFWHSTPKWQDLWAFKWQDKTCWGRTSLAYNKAALLLLMQGSTSPAWQAVRAKLFSLGPTPWFTHMLDLSRGFWALVEKGHAPVVWGLVS